MSVRMFRVCEFLILFSIRYVYGMISLEESLYNHDVCMQNLFELLSFFYGVREFLSFFHVFILFSFLFNMQCLLYDLYTFESMMFIVRTFVNY